ncbi:MAG: site-2 protease family protein [Acidimicrobiia bacterium]
MLFTGNDVVDAVIVVAIIVGSVIVHEVSHGLVAFRLGDSTAHRAGRLTLNPVPHLDPMGSIILPGLLALSGGTVFGWAKPVPVVPGNFRRPEAHMAVTALAGPASNIALAIIAGRVVFPVVDGNLTMARVTLGVVVLNSVLAVFNLLPIPPLDGSRLLPLILPPEGKRLYSRVEPYGFIILIVLLLAVDGFFRFLSGPINSIIDFALN